MVRHSGAMLSYASFMEPVMTRCAICDQKAANCDCSDTEREQASDLAEQQRIIRRLVRAAVVAYAELNEIRARDGVPYTHLGCRSGVTEESFSNVVDALNDAVQDATGHPAHCHPELYA